MPLPLASHLSGTLFLCLCKWPHGMEEGVKKSRCNNLGACSKAVIFLGIKMCLCIPEGAERAATVTGLVLGSEQTCPQLWSWKHWQYLVGPMWYSSICCFSSWPNMCISSVQLSCFEITETESVLELSFSAEHWFSQSAMFGWGTHNSFFMADSKWKSSNFGAEIMNAKIIA